MKKWINLFVIVAGLVILYAFPVMADVPPDPGGDPTGGTPVGGGSSIGGGLLTFLIAGVFYGIRKLKTDRNK
ncbi:MAG: hypothetical protein R2750_05620 [Bacteroidales bacterium]